MVKYKMQDVAIIMKKRIIDVLYNPRRIFEADCPEGYFESDRDYVLNNMELCLELLDYIKEMKGE